MNENPFLCEGIGLRMNQNCMNGTSSMATSKEMPKISVMDQWKLSRKSCIMPGITIRKGKNVILMASVAENMDLKKCVALKIDTCQRDIPSPIFSR